MNWHNNEDAGDLSMQHFADASMAAYEGFLERRNRDYDRLQWWIKRWSEDSGYFHDGNCEDCGSQLTYENTVEANWGWACVPCAKAWGWEDHR